ncbi:MAG: hypothetical protein Kow00121_03060 [Elainellaceae cyanobacterium]
MMNSRISVSVYAKLSLILSFMAAPLYWLSADSINAQLIPDNSLPENSIVRTSDNISVITGGTEAGHNLFHSFEQFNVERGQTANFMSPGAAIQNVLVRVTGGDRSEINGTVRTSGFSNPNLFLINPNGILFGANARLNVGGSFIATTANAIAFGDRGFFSASVPNNPSLLTVNPSAFLFHQTAAQATITNRSTISTEPSDNPSDHINGLVVPNGQSLLFVGGNVKMAGGQLQAPDGRIELGGLAAAGTVRLTGSSGNLRLGFPTGVARADVSIRGASADVVGNGRGSIAIRAQDIDISNVTTALRAGVDSESRAIANSPGDITLDATGRISIKQSAVDQIGIRTGAAGDIWIRAESLFLTGGTLASGIGAGNSGNITIHIRDRMSLSANSIISTEALGAGDAGNITINVHQGVIALANASSILTRINGSGNAGDIDIRVRELLLSNGAVVSSLTVGGGNAGDILVRASDAVQIVGVNPIDGFSSGLFTSSEGENSGQGGNIRVRTGSLSLADGAVLSARTRGDARGGNITLQNLDVLLMRRNSAVSASAGTANRGGNGGNISIDAQFVVAAPSENSDITANAFTGRGGNVDIVTQGLLGIQAQPEITPASDITASSEQGVSGSVTISSPEVNPAQGLIELPTDLIDASRSIVQPCPTGNTITADNNSQNQFIVTGRGGLPMNADEALGSDAVQVDLVTTEAAGTSADRPISLPESNATDGAIVEAQGWVVDATGNVVLTAAVPTATPIRSQFSLSCPSQQTVEQE